jgi:hypothetical protein
MRVRPLLQAIALYESMGFRTYGTERGFLLVADELHDEHSMVCPVTSLSGPWARSA